jgi:CubicO group peptidase (beta-lactamase class C family)
MKHRVFGSWLGFHTLLTALLSLAIMPNPAAQSFNPSAQPTSLRFDLPELEKLVEQTVTDAMEREHLPGIAFTLVKDGQVVISRGYGYANLEKQSAVTPDKTIFRIGSISKLLTAHAVVQLADLRKISLDDDVNKYLTQPKVDNRYPEPVRFWHLLTHTAGFDQVGDRGREFARLEDRKATLSEYLADTLIRIRPPGQVSSYDTWGITLAGYLVERVSGQPYAEFMKKSVFKPLKMARTNVETPEAMKADLAIGYRYQNGKHIPQGYEYYATLPASSIDATALDMAQYMIAVLGDGSADGQTAFMSKRATEQIRGPQFSNSSGIPAFAYGFFEDQIHGQRTIYHGGNMNGFDTRMYLVPEHKLGFFVAYNSDGSPRPRLQFTLTQKLMDYWFPPGRSNQTAALKTPLSIKTERFAGKYLDNVYCHTCYEGDQGVWPISGVTTIKAAGEGVLEIDGNRWLAVEPLVFQSERTGNRVAFREDETGQITHLVLKNAVQEKLTERLLDEALGASWREEPPTSLVAMVYIYNDQWEKAARAYASIAARRPRDGGAIFNAGVAWASGGKADEAIAALERAWELKARPPRTAFWLGAAFGLKGDKERAFEWLNRALDLGFDRRRLSTEPVLNGLRDDPRFKALLDR